MNKISVHISTSLSGVQPELTYILKLLAVNKRIAIDITTSDDASVKSIGHESTNSAIRVCDAFAKRRLSREGLRRGSFFELNDGTPDYISTAFFCITAQQEFDVGDLDEIGRFRYKNSYQAALSNPTANIVQECFDKIAGELQIPHKPEKSSFFLSHDIDTVHGALMEDGFNVLKKGRIDLLLGFIFNAMIGKPAWLNMDQIMKIESDYDCRSTFFWIVNKGILKKKYKNADYNFSSKKMQLLFKKVETNGFENGIHKSLSDETFDVEIKKLGVMPLGNRYHYLKFNLPEGYDAIERAGLKLDASLGFSEQWGFRNNYGLPYNPYNFEKRRPYSFVEVPLHIMDRTFFNKRMDIKQVEKEVFQFFEKHTENCVLSVLWHNNFFTDYKYKGYLSLYKKILQYIYENNFKTIRQEEIIEKYGMLWP